MRRRAYLGVIGVAATAGCIGVLGSEQDSDGDGVPDQHDYAPRDPNVQSESDVQQKTTQTTTRTTTTTKTTTSGPPDPRATVRVWNRQPMGEGYNVTATYVVGSADIIRFVARKKDEGTILYEAEGGNSEVEKRIAGDEAPKPPVAPGATVLAGSMKNGKTQKILAEVVCAGEVNSG